MIKFVDVLYCSSNFDDTIFFSFHNVSLSRFLVVHLFCKFFNVNKTYLHVQYEYVMYP